MAVGASSRLFVVNLGRSSAAITVLSQIAATFPDGQAVVEFSGKPEEVEIETGLASSAGEFEAVAVLIGPDSELDLPQNEAPSIADHFEALRGSIEAAISAGRQVFIIALSSVTASDLAGLLPESVAEVPVTWLNEATLEDDLPELLFRIARHLHKDGVVPPPIPPVRTASLLDRMATRIDATEPPPIPPQQSGPPPLPTMPTGEQARVTKAQQRENRPQAGLESWAWPSLAAIGLATLAGAAIINWPSNLAIPDVSKARPAPVTEVAVAPPPLRTPWDAPEDVRALDEIWRRVLKESESKEAARALPPGQGAQPPKSPLASPALPPPSETVEPPTGGAVTPRPKVEPNVKLAPTIPKPFEIELPKSEPLTADEIADCYRNAANRLFAKSVDAGIGRAVIRDALNKLAAKIGRGDRVRKPGHQLYVTCRSGDRIESYHVAGSGNHDATEAKRMTHITLQALMQAKLVGLDRELDATGKQTGGLFPLVTTIGEFEGPLYGVFSGRILVSVRSDLTNALASSVMVHEWGHRLYRSRQTAPTLSIADLFINEASARALQYAAAVAANGNGSQEYLAALTEKTGLTRERIAAVTRNISYLEQTIRTSGQAPNELVARLFDVFLIGGNSVHFAMYPQVRFSASREVEIRNALGTLYFLDHRATDRALDVTMEASWFAALGKGGTAEEAEQAIRLRSIADQIQVLIAREREMRTSTLGSPRLRTLSDRAERINPLVDDASLNLAGVSRADWDAMRSRLKQLSAR